MLIAVFDVVGLVHQEFLAKGQNMNQTVHRKERSVRPSKFSSSETDPKMVFRYLLSVQTQCTMPGGKAQHSSGSTSAVLTTFGPLLLPRLKSALKGQRIQDIVEIQMNTT
jgi:hypothetical protein